MDFLRRYFAGGMTPAEASPAAAPDPAPHAEATSIGPGLDLAGMRREPEAAPPALCAIPHAAPKADVVPLHPVTAARFMLAARLASASALNPPKAIARRRRPPASTLKPMPRRRPASPAGDPRARRDVRPPRVLKQPVRSADVVRLVARPTASLPGLRKAA
jgi:hypothetical protein